MKIDAASMRRIRVILLILVITAGITLPFIKAGCASYTAVIKTADGKFFRAKSFIIMGNTILCLKDRREFQARFSIRADIPPEYRPAILSMKDVAFIEIIPDRDDAGIEVPPSYLGTYRINASGHQGYLFLGVTDGRLYGSIRFPKWAKGVYEPLKGLGISGNTIRFVRSVTTAAEMKRVGAPVYFTQSYTGTYGAGGATIKGFYVRDGANYMWEAVKVR